ncbi:MAG: thiamine diphosphokinase [Fimbriimonadaceae bacterium]|nr:thiamine diphosphokinase [Fimbriimonadaceae bacterium]QYK58401.1 MAG: thiamine diphosphokinase [Fimbriimonadaceae bacterium]
MLGRALVVLAGQDASDGHLAAWAGSSDALYAADSAADRLFRLGFEPVVVGDLDSCDRSLFKPTTRVVEDADPDRTDCDKALSLAKEDGWGAVTVAGVEGDLFDHWAASLSSCLASGLFVRLALRLGIATLLRGGDSVRVEDALGRRVSLLPMVRSTGVELRGTLWELDGAVIEPGGRLSVSNQGTGEVEASLRTGAAWLFVSRHEAEGPVW